VTRAARVAFDKQDLSMITLDIVRSATVRTDSIVDISRLLFHKASRPQISQIRCVCILHLYPVFSLHRQAQNPPRK